MFTSTCLSFVQGRGIPPVPPLNVQDTEIYWPTAAGKSLIYQLFALLSWQRKRGIVLVVEPTIPVLQEGQVEPAGGQGLSCRYGVRGLGAGMFSF